MPSEKSRGEVRRSAADAASAAASSAMPLVDQRADLSADAQLARRMFIGGCFGLPWLWIVNALYFRAALRQIDAAAAAARLAHPPTARVANPAVTRSAAAAAAPAPATAAAPLGAASAAMSRSEKELRAWVRRSTTGGALAVLALVAWNLYFQMNWRSLVLFVPTVAMPEEERTRW